MTDTRDDAPASAARKPDLAAISGDGEEWKGADLAAVAVTINRPHEELFAYFRDFRHLANFMENVERIDTDGGDKSHWVVSAPGGKVEWDATITQEEQGRLIAWTAAEGADVANSGRVIFADAGVRGTTVSATIVYDTPYGALGKLVAKISQKEPAIQLRRDLRRFKQLMETGEIAVSAHTRELAEGQRAPAS